MNRRPNGFTAIEMVIALVVGMILLSFALPAFQAAGNRIAVRNAKAMYATFQQRARARAVEMGETVLVWVDVQGDSALMLTPSTGIHDVTRFGDQLNVDLRSSVNSYLMCMTPRGYADYDCGSFGGFITGTTNSAIRLEFWQNADSTTLIVLPMGQLVGL